MTTMTIARYYDESKNPEQAHLPGVPLRDLTEAEFTSYPDWLQSSIDAQPFYRTTKPRPDGSATDTKET